METRDVGINILNLSDDALLEILKFLNATDLWQLHRTCKRFGGLVATKKLWRRIDLRDDPIDGEKISFAMKKANELTEDVRMCSKGRYSEIIPDRFVDCLRCTNLTVLALENQKLCGHKIKLADFPEGLVELSLRKTYVTSAREFLERSNEQMTNLKVIILDQCFWVETFMLLQLSKYKSLEILSLYNCKRIDDSNIAYISLAGRFGFQKLRILDCRFSGLGNQVLRTLYSKPHLQELYFQSYHSTYFLEKARRELDTYEGLRVKKHSYLTEFDDIPMFDVETIQSYFGETEYSAAPNTETISDDGTLVYRFTECSKDVDNHDEFKSVLYEPPYSKCTCFKSSKSGCNASKGPSSKMKSVKKRGIAKTEEVIDNELEYATNYLAMRNMYLIVPVKKKRSDIEVEASLENHSVEWIQEREPRNNYEIAMLEHTDFTRVRMQDDHTLFLVQPQTEETQCVSVINGVNGPSNSHLNDNDRPVEGNSSAEENTRKRKRSWDATHGLQYRCGRLSRSRWCVVPVLDEYRNNQREHYLLINALGRPTKPKVNVHSISLRGFKRISDMTLHSFMHLGLKLLDVTLTKVTEEGVKAFMLLNPNCRVIHESLCQCRPRMHF